MHQFSIQGRSASPLGRKELVIHRVIDDADLGLAILHEGDGDAELWDPPNKVCSAVDGIDDPYMIVERAAAFFTEERVSWKAFQETAPNKPFDFGINGRKV